MTKEQFEIFQEVLEGMRDDSLADHRRTGDRADAERASSYRRVLNLLHTVSRGEHGTPLAEQPSPWEPVQENRTEVSR